MNNNATQLILVLIIGLIIGLIAGYSLSTYLTFKTTQSQPTEQQIKQQVVQNLREKGVLPPEPESITEVAGTIAKVGENQLTLETEQRYDDPFNKFVPQTVTVKVTDQTKIVRRKRKSDQIMRQQEQEFEQKMAQYEQQGKDVPSTLNPPQPFTEQEIELSQLKPETEVTVLTESNIKGKSEFEAKTIKTEVQQSATTTAAE